MDGALIGIASVIDLVAVAVFAVSGALAASRKQMDIFGFAMLATAVGVGGGTVRDVLLGRLPVFWVEQPAYVIVCTCVAALVFFTAHIPESRYRVLLWCDALGLALVCVTGTEKGLEASGSIVVALVMGMITSAFGGIIRDVLSGEAPLLLRREIYVTAALAGGLAFVAADRLGLARNLALGAGAAVCFLVRAAAIERGWSLPTYRARPGRPASVAGDVAKDRGD